MAEAIGRDLLIQIDTGGGYTTIAAVRTKSVSINNEPVDITSDDSDAWRTLLAEPGSRSMDMSISGLTTDEVLMDIITTGTSSYALSDYKIVYPDTSVHTGDFFLASLSRTGEYNGAVTFEASLQSSGEVVYTGVV